jgi:hypothetical protein
MIFVFTVTVWSLVLQIRAGLERLGGGSSLLDTGVINGVVALMLMLLAGLLCTEAVRVLLRPATVAPQV